MTRSTLVNWREIGGVGGIGTVGRGEVATRRRSEKGTSSPEGFPGQNGEYAIQITSVWARQGEKRGEEEEEEGFYMYVQHYASTQYGTGAGYVWPEGGGRGIRKREKNRFYFIASSSRGHTKKNSPIIVSCSSFLFASSFFCAVITVSSSFPHPLPLRIVN